jgi:hypothetical protein
MTPTTLSPRVAALLEKTRRSRGRLIFALDATASREAMWDMASQLQSQMFEEAAKIGGLDVQLVHYRGTDEFHHTAWLGDTQALIREMTAIRCASGATKIAQVLRHIRAENLREKVSAAVFVGDACEEMRGGLYDAAANLNVPLFLFQEGENLALYIDPRTGDVRSDDPPQTVENVFRELARLTNGAYGKFNVGAAKQLGELLRAVAAFAVGGIAALANQHTDSARKLLGQMK